MQLPVCRLLPLETCVLLGTQRHLPMAPDSAFQHHSPTSLPLAAGTLLQADKLPRRPRPPPCPPRCRRSSLLPSPGPSARPATRTAALRSTATSALRLRSCRAKRPTSRRPPRCRRARRRRQRQRACTSGSSSRAPARTAARWRRAAAGSSGWRPQAATTSVTLTRGSARLWCRPWTRWVLLRGTVLARAASVG